MFSAHTPIRDLFAGASLDDARSWISGLRNPSARFYCILALDNIPGRATEQYLNELLDDETAQRPCLITLGKIGAVSSGARVATFIDHAHSPTRRAAIEAVGRLRDRAAVPRLRDLLAATEQQQSEDSEYEIVRALGRIGGALAHAQLLEYGQTERTAEVAVRMCMITREPSGIDAAKALVGAFSSARAELAQAIVKPDFEDAPMDALFGRPAAPFLTDANLFSHVVGQLEELDTLPANARMMAEVYIVRALAAFKLPTATQVLHDLARQVPIARAPRDLVIEARAVLAHRGDRAYARAEVVTELDRLEERRYVGFRDVERLLRWPTDVVRAELLSRIERDPPSWYAVYLLKWFAGAADQTLFARLESHVDGKIANVAHEAIHGRGWN